MKKTPIQTYVSSDSMYVPPKTWGKKGSYVVVHWKSGERLDT